MEKARLGFKRCLLGAVGSDRPPHPFLRTSGSEGYAWV